MSQSRRTFLKTTSLAAAGTGVPYFFTAVRTMADETKTPNRRLVAGCIGNGGMGRGDANAIKKYCDIVALCDVDSTHSHALAEGLKLPHKPDIYDDYRRLLDRKDINVVTISTPDHWHTRIALDALRAGKDVYCQKPLTLTIDEGKLLCRAVKETGRTVQVGTQQRSENKLQFQTAVALVQEGRIGRVKRVTCAIGGAPKGGPFPKTKPPAELNWERWLGQAPLVEYIKQRCHGDFRWWYEYSGGKMTDWGAHHVDIAQWAIGMDHAGPESIEVVSVNHPVPLKRGMPTVDDSYNTALSFTVRCQFPGGIEMLIRDRADDLGFDNGIMFEGEKGRFFVNRGKLTGKPVDELKTNPIPEAKMTALRNGKPVDSHMGNFIRCVTEGGTPISDVWTHHRALTTCHLANIAMRLGRTLRWDAASEQIVGDDDANAWQKREQRKGYEIV